MKISWFPLAAIRDMFGDKTGCEDNVGGRVDELPALWDHSSCRIEFRTRINRDRKISRKMMSLVV
jgi:hypothetical protein